MDNGLIYWLMTHINNNQWIHKLKIFVCFTWASFNCVVLKTTGLSILTKFPFGNSIITLKLIYSVPKLLRI